MRGRAQGDAEHRSEQARTPVSEERGGNAAIGREGATADESGTL
jgi:hypothetical protein